MESCTILLPQYRRDQSIKRQSARDIMALAWLHNWDGSAPRSDPQAPAKLPPAFQFYNSSGGTAPVHFPVKHANDTSNGSQIQSQPPVAATVFAAALTPPAYDLSRAYDSPEPPPATAAYPSHATSLLACLLLKFQRIRSVLIYLIGAIPPELPPTVEEAYRRKCIELKRRLNEVEEANDQQRIRVTRARRGITKLRLERAFLLEQLAKRTSTNVEDSEGSPSPPPSVRSLPITSYTNVDTGRQANAIP